MLRTCQSVRGCIGMCVYVMCTYIDSLCVYIRAVTSTFVLYFTKVKATQVKVLLK